MQYSESHTTNSKSVLAKLREVTHRIIHVFTPLHL